ncbi:MAG: dipeptidase [Chloroflexota bacterium]|nr:MAG: dipeptidase [Chloroflexota bacterium]
MTDARTAALQYARDHRQQFLEELIEFSKIPSISTDPTYKSDVQRAAEWVADRLRKLNIQKVTVYPTAGHPVVYGEYLAAGAGAPTALLYGHYDVQPAEPLELWESGAFEPTLRGDYLYARGASDMKAQLLVLLKSIEAIMQTGKFPVNLKFLFEGEEEIGSPNLPPFIKANREMLACDIAVNPDTGMIDPDVPTITYALRGMAYFEVRLTGPAHDLHSGVFGGVVHNPAQVLCDLVAGMRDEHGCVTLPGFYDRVRSLDDEERAELARLPLGEEFYLSQTGVPELWNGEEGYTLVERIGARPTLEVNGLLAGYTGPGAKTVLPAQAMAKISMRLVPDQDPKEVYQQLLAYMEEKAPKTVKWEISDLVGGPASISDRHSRYVEAMRRALSAVWEKKPVFKREGGSVPVVSHFQEILGIETVNTGFGMLGDNAHGPNEKQNLPNWYRGIDSFIHFYFNLVDER